MASATRVSLSLEAALAVGAQLRGSYNLRTDFLTQVGLAHPCVSPHMNRKCFSIRRNARLESSLEGAGRLVFYDFVAAARGGFQPCSIQCSERAAAVTDQIPLLQRSGGSVHTLATHAQHV